MSCAMLKLVVSLGVTSSCIEYIYIFNFLYMWVSLSFIYIVRRWGGVTRGVGGVIRGRWPRRAVCSAPGIVGVSLEWRHICRCRRCKQQKVSEGDRQETLQWISGHFICCCGWIALLSAVMSLGMAYKPNLNAQQTLAGNHGTSGEWTSAW